MPDQKCGALVREYRYLFFVKDITSCYSGVSVLAYEARYPGRDVSLQALYIEIR